jgi:hypothetical protein
MKKQQTMYTTIKEPVEQQSVEENPKDILLNTAISIAEHRLSTIGETASFGTVLEKLQRLNDLEIDRGKAYEEEITSKHGDIYEALFFVYMQRLGIPITISTDYEDMKGTDFHICYKPIDVTYNPESEILQSKIERNHATVLCLPKYMNQKSVMQDGSGDTLLQAFLEKRLTPQKYLEKILTVNNDFRKILEDKNSFSIYAFDNVSKTYLHHLQHTLGYLSRVLERFQ